MFLCDRGSLSSTGSVSGCRLKASLCIALRLLCRKPYKFPINKILSTWPRIVKLQKKLDITLFCIFLISFLASSDFQRFRKFVENIETGISIYLLGKNIIFITFRFRYRKKLRWHFLLGLSKNSDTTHTNKPKTKVSYKKKQINWSFSTSCVLICYF